MGSPGKDSKSEIRLSGIVPKERIHRIDFSRPPKQLVERYLKIEDLTSCVSDILDAKGVRGAIPGSILSPIIPGKRIVGPAVTVKHIFSAKAVLKKMVDQDKPKMGGLSDAREIAEPGDVLVIDGGGRMDISSQGYLAALRMKKKGLAGTILDCGVRDIEGIRRIDYPTWARGMTPVSGLYRFEAYEINGSIMCAGTQVNPGDLMAADECGVVVVPSSLIEEVLIDLENKHKKEQDIERSILEEV